MTARQTRLLLMCILAMSPLVGCASVAPKGSLTESGAVLESTANGASSQSPFVLEVLDEVNDGEQLNIRGRIVAKIPWSRADVLVRLSTLDDAGNSKIVLRTLSELAPRGDMLGVDVPTEFVVAAPSHGISNYQIELLWGEEARPFISQAKSADSPGEQVLALRKLEVHRVPSESCATPDECSVKFTITGEFFNQGGATVRNVMIEAGFSPADKLDLPGQILENARRIEVRNLNLGPGGTKPFRLALEKFIPSTEQIAPRPVVRIVSVDPA